jgi:hypothetical protein
MCLILLYAVLICDIRIDLFLMPTRTETVLEIWLYVFHALKQSVPSNETKCSSVRNNLFHTGETISYNQ